MTDWLYDTLLATSLLMVLILVLRKPVAQYFGAGVAYGLWALPAARLCIPAFAVEVPRPHSDPLIIETDFSAQAPSSMAQDVAISSTGAPPGFDWFTVLLAIWLGGAAILFLIQMIRYCALRDELLSNALEIDRIGSIRVIESDQVSGPMAFGLFRRFVAVPMDFAQIFAPREQELALAHELAHHKAGDLYANLAAFTFLCLQWFNPLAWLSWSAFRFDQEAACDARVLVGADIATRQSYGRAMARTATRNLPSFAMALNSPHTLIERLRRVMMQDPSKRRRFSGRLAILVAGAIALPLTATTIPVFAEDVPKAKDATTAETAPKKQKVIVIKSNGEAPANVDIEGDEATPFVKTTKKDGKTIILRSNKELSEADVERMVALAVKSMAEADAKLSGDEKALDGEDGANKIRRIVVHRNTTIHDSEGGKKVMILTGDGKKEVMINGKKMTFAVPELSTADIIAQCKEGDLTTNTFRTTENKTDAVIAISICGKGKAGLKNAQILAGLKAARAQLEKDKDIPEATRKMAVDNLQKQIERVEKEPAEENAMNQPGT